MRPGRGPSRIQEGTRVPLLLLRHFWPHSSLVIVKSRPLQLNTNHHRPIDAVFVPRFGQSAATMGHAPPLGAETPSPAPPDQPSHPSREELTKG